MNKEEIREHCNAYGYSDEEVGAFKDGYQQGRADATEEIVPKAFEWLMTMDIIDCDGCDYKSECVNRNMNCFDVMAEKFLEQLKEQNNE